MRAFRRPAARLQFLHSLTGIAGLLLLCWLLSERRSAIAWRPVLAGLALALLLALAALVVVGGFAFAALGFLLAARAKTIEGIGGLMNLFQLPMWLLGGVYFDVDRLDGIVRRVAELLPLTHLNRALRDVMLAPNGFAEVGVPLLGLGAFAAVCFGIGLKLFRWQ